MLREMPKPKFIEVGRPAAQPPAPPADLNWQRVEEFLRVRELSENTKKVYRRHLRQFDEWLQKPWQAAAHRDIDRYKQHLKQLPSKRGGSLSPASINQVIASLKSFFKWLTVKDYITRDPTLTTEVLKEPPKPPSDLAETEVSALFDGLDYRGESEARDLAILHLLSHGLRAGEVSALNVSSYDGKRVHIVGAKWGSDGTVPLKPEAIAALDSYLGWMIRQGFNTAKESPLFVSLSNNSKGKRLGYRGIYDLVKELAKVAGLEDVHPHRLRHTCATELVLAGMDTMLAQRLVRIRSARVFARYGDRALDIKMEEAFDEMYGSSSKGSDENASAGHSLTSDSALSKKTGAENSRPHQTSHSDVHFSDSGGVASQQKAQAVYQLKITLKGIRPAIWRRVQVSSDATLEHLHWGIQFAMGWEGYHLHSFAIQGAEAFMSRSSLGLDELDSRDELLITLSQVVTEEKFKFFYLYDFGDSWAHEVLVEKMLTAKTDTSYPICVEAKRACPPEDCGGTWGYQTLLKAIKDPKHPEHALRVEWLGSSFDPEKVDLDEINDLLKSIPRDLTEFNGYIF